MRSRRLAALALILAPAALAGDWTNAGGNPARNGQSDEVAPVTPTLAWSGGRPSLTAWQPVTAGRRLFVVRQATSVPDSVPNDSPVVCQDLDFGTELWTFKVPYHPGDWTTWIAGCSDGKVYCSRSGNGDTSEALLYALDQKTGKLVWTSAEPQRAGAYDGAVFAPDGDPIVAWQTAIRRIDAATGATLWTAPRTSPVAGLSGVALHGDAIYALDESPAINGQVIKRFDLSTGAFLYESPLMLGFLSHSTPFVAPDGTIFVSRTQNFAPLDFDFAFTDTGAALTQKWAVPTSANSGASFAVGLDGSPYTLLNPNLIIRRNPATGGITAASEQINFGGGGLAVRLAVDAAGHVLATNGGGSDGKLFCFTADLQTLWSVAVPYVNIGTPCLGQDGTLVVAGIGTDMRAYRTGLPWADLQLGLSASLPQPPELSATGTLLPASTTTLQLAEARPSSLTTLIVGLSLLSLPFKGGTLVPDANLLFGPFVTDASGSLMLSSAWPAGLPSGTQLWFQEWIADPTGAHGFEASNALRATSP